MGLTSDTNTALHMTLNGLATLIQKLLSKMSNVLTAVLQSDQCCTMDIQDAELI